MMIDLIRGLAGTFTYVAAALLALVPTAQAQSASPPKRVALVIGIDRYDNLPVDKQLLKAANDARAVGAALRSLGYQVIAAENITRIEFLTQWQTFLNAVKPGDQTAIFFAGHGIEIAGQNYLIPADVPRVGDAQEELLKGTAIAFDFLLEALRDRSPGVSLVILDACRNNPFVTARGRSIGRTRGLTDARPPRGMFIMYSAGAGEEALDSFGGSDPSDNSVYTRALIPLLTTAGLDITELARQVRRQVHEQVQQIGHRQTPAYYDELIGRFCPAGCDGKDGPPPEQPTPNLDAPAGIALPRGGGAPFDEPPPAQRTGDPFAGAWRVKGTGNCPRREWSGVWTIKDGVVTSARGEMFGKIDKNGRLNLLLPSRLVPGHFAKTVGRIAGDRGTGTFNFKRCGGSFTMSRL